MFFAVLTPLAPVRADSVIKEDGAQLVTSCGRRAELVEQLPAGTRLKIRSSMAGQGDTCYRVTAEVDGRTLRGYVSGSAIGDLSDFEQARRGAGRIGQPATPPTSSREADVAAVEASISTSNQGLPVSEELQGLLEEATGMIRQGQPGGALSLLEQEISQVSSREKPHPALLALAGVAAWRADRSKQALEYWDQALAQSPDPQLERLAANLRHETEADESNQVLVGGRVTLRYEGTNISSETAHAMLQIVEREVAKVSGQLGCNSRERIVAVAQSREAYMATTNAPEWSGGRFDGRTIRVPVLDQGADLDAQTRETLEHETVHACLRLLGNWPHWFDEGLAQYLSGRRSSQQARDGIAALAKADKLPSLNQLAGGWGGFDTTTATVAYAIGLRAVEIFQQGGGGYDLRNLMRHPDQLPRITAELDKKLHE